MSETERTNPEVMGRTEPRPVDARPNETRATDSRPTQPRPTEPRSGDSSTPEQARRYEAQTAAEPPAKPAQMHDVWPEMTEYRRRFDELQSEFIEEPRDAVRKAEKLVEEAMDRMAGLMRDRVQTIQKDVDLADTEKLRLAMRDLKAMIESMGSRRAA